MNLIRIFTNQQSTFVHCLLKPCESSKGSWITTSRLATTCASPRPSRRRTMTSWTLASKENKKNQLMQPPSSLMDVMIQIAAIAYDECDDGRNRPSFHSPSLTRSTTMTPMPHKSSSGLGTYSITPRPCGTMRELT